MYPSHGANPQHLYKTLGKAMSERIIDFSENSVPYGPPAAIRKNWMDWFDHAVTYPDPDGTELLALLAEKHALPVETIVIGNGAAELMMVTARLFTGKKVGVIHPAFSEYKRVLDANQAETVPFTAHHPDWLPDDNEIIRFLQEPDRGLFICNPNNPTGVCIPKEKILEWLSVAEQSGSVLLVDEAFMDMTDERNSVSGFISESLIVFRSMTKLYRIAGLRLGYAMMSPRHKAAIQQLLPHWNVNGIALAAGAAALQDPLYTDSVRHVISLERSYVTTWLTALGFTVTHSEANYVLIKPPERMNTHALWIALLEQGLVLRHTYNYEVLNGNWLRIGLKTREENEQLVEAVKEWVRSQS